MIYLLCEKNKTWINNQYKLLQKKFWSNHYFYSYEWNLENKIPILNNILNNDLLINEKIILINDYISDVDIDELLKKWNHNQSKLIIILTSNNKKISKLNPHIKIIENNNIMNKKINKKTILNLFLDNHNIILESNLYEWLIINNFSDSEIINELSKIKYLKKIKLSDVDKYCDFKITNKIFDLLDKIWNIDFVKSLNIYKSIDLDDGQIFYFINKEFISIYYIKCLSIIYSSDKINEFLKIHPFRFKNLLNKSRKINFNQLNKIFRILKTSQIDSYKLFVDKATITQILIYDIFKVICII